jgi:ketosteroid isomerase-like protein
METASPLGCRHAGSTDRLGVREAGRPGVDTATSGGGAMADSDDERDIMQCDDRRFKAMVRGDLAALRMALVDSLTYTHSSGVLDTKTQFLASLTLGQLSYKSIIPEARSVRVYGGAGIVTGTARMEITARGQDTRFRIRYLAVYVKAQDRWQLVAWQSTRVPDA